MERCFRYIIKKADELNSYVAKTCMDIDRENGNLIYDKNIKINMCFKDNKNGEVYKVCDIDELLDMVFLNNNEIAKKIDFNLNNKQNNIVDNSQHIKMIMNIRNIYKEKAINVINNLGFMMAIITLTLALTT